MPKIATLLFVDDDEQATKYFCRAFKNSFSIVFANSVADGQAILDDMHAEIAVLITDQRMPKQQGIELLKYSRTHYPDIILLLTTTYSDTDSVLRVINQVGIFRYIPKPWDLQKFEETLQKSIEKFEYQQHKSTFLSSDVLILECIDNCECWLMYITQNHESAIVYQKGIETLMEYVQLHISEPLHEGEVDSLTMKVDEVRSHFLNAEIFKKSLNKSI